MGDTVFDLLIRNGQVVNAFATVQADVAIKGEKIAGIFEPGILSNARKSVDASGLYVIPGGVDPHVHFGMEFGGAYTKDDFRSGTIAAAFGGTTTVIDFAFQTPGASALEALRGRMEEARGKAITDYSFHCCLTDGSAKTIEEMDEIFRLGVVSFKLFMVYREVGLWVSDGTLMAAFRKAASLGALPVVHGESEELVSWSRKQLLEEGKCLPRDYPASRPRFAELEAVCRAIFLAKQAGSALYLVHISSRDAAGEVGRARGQGFPIYGETCPHYLTLTEAVYEGPTGYNYVMSPPLRSSEDHEGLWNALRKGDLSTIASDESSWDTVDKAKGQSSFNLAPPGLVGAETRLSLVFSEGVQKGRISINRFVELVATNPAKLYGLYPRKGIIAVGSDADIVLIDPEKEISLNYKDVHHNAGYSPYEGWKVKGCPITTICRGTLVIENRRLVGPVGYGEFLKRTISPDFLTGPSVR